MRIAITNRAQNRAQEREAVRNLPDTFDMLMSLPYISMPPNELQAVMRERSQKEGGGGAETCAKESYSNARASRRFLIREKYFAGHVDATRIEIPRQSPMSPGRHHRCRTAITEIEFNDVKNEVNASSLTFLEGQNFTYVETDGGLWERENINFQILLSQRRVKECTEAAGNVMNIEQSEAGRPFFEGN